jgi:hypothetical protein
MSLGRDFCPVLKYSEFSSQRHHEANLRVMGRLDQMRSITDPSCKIRAHSRTPIQLNRKKETVEIIHVHIVTDKYFCAD